MIGSVEDACTDVVIRRATSDEAEAVWRVTRLAYEQYRGVIRPEFTALSVTVSAIRRDIRLRRCVYGIAICDGEIVGTLRYRRWRRHLGLSRLAVHPEYRGRGIGTKLMEWAERQARRLGVPELRGEVRAALPHLVDYYRAMGFRTIGRRSGRGYKGYLIVMRKRVSRRARDVPPPK